MLPRFQPLVETEREQKQSENKTEGEADLLKTRREGMRIRSLFNKHLLTMSLLLGSNPLLRGRISLLRGGRCQSNFHCHRRQYGAAYSPERIPLQQRETPFSREKSSAVECITPDYNRSSRVEGRCLRKLEGEPE